MRSYIKCLPGGSFRLDMVVYFPVLYMHIDLTTETILNKQHLMYLHSSFVNQVLCVELELDSGRFLFDLSNLTALWPRWTVITTWIIGYLLLFTFCHSSNRK